MKTRIIQNSEGDYMVQKKYRYRPFWIDDITYTGWDGMPLENWVSSYEKAKIKELQFHKEHNYKKVWKIKHFYYIEKMKKLLLLLPLAIVCLGGCTKEFNYICEYEGGKTVGIVRHPIESDTHICSMFSGGMECFDRELCEEVQ